MKLKTLLFSLACFFPALAQASEVEFIYSGRIDSLYGYNVPAGRYKHNDHRDHWINLFSLNLGLEKEFNADYSAGLYADLNAGHHVAGDERHQRRRDNAARERKLEGVRRIQL